MTTEEIQIIDNEKLQELFAINTGWQWSDDEVISPDGTSRNRFWGSGDSAIDRLYMLLPDINDIKAVWPSIEKLFDDKGIWIHVIKTTDGYVGYAYSDKKRHVSGNQETPGKAIAVTYCMCFDKKKVKLLGTLMPDREIMNN